MTKRQTKPIPFDVELTKNKVDVEEKMKFTLKGKNNEKFKGFLVRVEDSDGFFDGLVDPA